MSIFFCPCFARPNVGNADGQITSKRYMTEMVNAALIGFYG